MTTAKPNILELAKQGNPKAIEALLNRNLQPKGITAKVALKDSCLQIMVEAVQVPTESVVAAFIQKGIENLSVPAIKTLKIYGRQIGEEFPAWSQAIELIKCASKHAVTNGSIENQASYSKKKCLTTTLAQEVLAQYLNLKARVSVGISYADFPPILGSAKLAVQKFERSQDSKVFIGLTELIEKIMLYYELSLECFKQKVESGGETTYFFGIPLAGIEHNSPVGRAILNDFPELYSSLHKFDVLIDTLWARAIELTNRLDDALTEPIAIAELENPLPKTAIQQASSQLEKRRYLMSGVERDSQANNKTVAGILGIFLGAFGLHKFVLGYKVEGLVMLLVSILSGGTFAPVMAVVGFIEGLIYLSKSDKDFILTYVRHKKGWF